MKIWSYAIKDSNGNEIDTDSLTAQGTQFTGTLYEPSESSSVMINRRGDAYDGTLYTLNDDDGVYCYQTSATTVTVQGAAYTGAPLYISTGGAYRPLGQTLYVAGSSKTYYTRSNGARRYEVSAVDETLYRDGGIYTAAVYVPTSRKLYNAGKALAFTPATIETSEVTALCV